MAAHGIEALRKCQALATSSQGTYSHTESLLQAQKVVQIRSTVNADCHHVLKNWLMHSVTWVLECYPTVPYRITGPVIEISSF
jgi:hypothetical protein